MQKQYDYIIAGSGAAGLSLLMHIMVHPFFATKRIAVIDQSIKTHNDHTWCFWEKEDGLFDDIVYHKWSSLLFESNHWSGPLHIAPYEYKMIRSADFYAYVLNYAKQCHHIDFITAEIKKIDTDERYAYVTINDETIQADYVFSSLMEWSLREMKAWPQNKKYHWLLQHFKGWMIETPTDVFDISTASFMDFRVSQQYGTTFMYLLPIAPNKALVEYTLFTENVLADEVYKNELSNYLKDFVGLTEWKVLEEEKGIIPMTDFPFPVSKGRIIYMGTAGGQTKPSTGYTFQFIQKHSAAIIDRLIQGKTPAIQRDWQQLKFSLYDSTLLSVMQKGELGGDAIFAKIFKACKATSVLRFLDNESTLTEELRIMNSVPLKHFLPAAMQELVRRCLR